jgi:hypothetical protein
METERRRKRSNRMTQSAAVLAEMVSMGGMDSKWGRRLFIAIQVNGYNLRLFDNRASLLKP